MNRRKPLPTDIEGQNQTGHMPILALSLTGGVGFSFKFHVDFMCRDRNAI